MLKYSNFKKTFFNTDVTKLCISYFIVLIKYVLKGYIH